MRKKLFQREALIFKTRGVDPGVFVVSESGSNSDFFYHQTLREKNEKLFQVRSGFFSLGSDRDESFLVGLIRPKDPRPN